MLRLSRRPSDVACDTDMVDLMPAERRTLFRHGALLLLLSAILGQTKARSAVLLD
jgi:hypothetical protein